MKRLVFLFLVAMIGSQFAFGQGVSLSEAKSFISRERYGVLDGDFYCTDKYKDEAYEAPNSALIKKWYIVPRNIFEKFQFGYIQFKQNGTFLLYLMEEGYHIEITGTWRRSKLDLNLTYNCNLAKAIADDMSGYSKRRQDEINKERISHQATIRKKKIQKEKFEILKLTNEVFSFEKSINDSYFFSPYLMSEEYLEERISRWG